MTLIEVMIAVVLLGLIVVAVLYAMGSSIVLSDVHRSQATAETVIIRWQRPLNMDDLVVRDARFARAAIACHHSTPCPGVHDHVAWRFAARNRHMAPAGDLTGFVAQMC